MKTNNIARHGDLSFHPVSNIEGVKIASNKHVLAVGEHTNHKHVVEQKTGTVDIYRDSNGQIFLMVEGEAVITHEEHRPITLTTGSYQMKFEREFCYFTNEIKQVVD